MQIRLFSHFFAQSRRREASLDMKIRIIHFDGIYDSRGFLFLWPGGKRATTVVKENKMVGLFRGYLFRTDLEPPLMLCEVRKFDFIYWS